MILIFCTVKSNRGQCRSPSRWSCISLLLASCSFYMQNVHLGIWEQAEDKKNDWTQSVLSSSFTNHSTERNPNKPSPAPSRTGGFETTFIQCFCPLTKASSGILGCASYNAVCVVPLFFVQSSPPAPAQICGCSFISRAVILASLSNLGHKV